MKIGLVTIQKSRAPWLHEWLAFHHLVGFEKFYFYAHNCTDHTGPALSQSTELKPHPLYAQEGWGLT